ncbi:thiamine diphosphokinase [Szabonella alba]|uniref:Thiamine diphosphokinase n=1 Tax=Szabonella alba TaxID=2804194 RepID=A0A8K0V974_9RHOB|nr:thiamine diphosphokinase [Szabonella alba]MBL4915988.1 thiamine diphosphokinase [Szabonella alba]
MILPIVEVTGGATLLAGGPVRRGDLQAGLALAPDLVAVDGGADHALRLGHEPRAVIGDMDSISDAARQRLAGRIHVIAEQDSTDFEKALSRIRARFVLALGCLGGRVDHELAVFSALVQQQEAPPCLLVGAQDVVFAAPAGRPIRLPLRSGDRVSLFPMAPVTGLSEGLRWPIRGLDLRPDGRVGTSNAATGPVHLRFDAAGMLVILPRNRLKAAFSALVSGD